MIYKLQSTSTQSAAQMELLSQVVKIFKFILIAPATNAVSERSSCGDQMVTHTHTNRHTHT